jgi:thiamine-monophosphate kinase
MAATFPALTTLTDEWRLIGTVIERSAAPAVTVDGEPYLDSPPGWDHFR